MAPAGRFHAVAVGVLKRELAHFARRDELRDRRAEIGTPQRAEVLVG